MTAGRLKFSIMHPIRRVSSLGAVLAFVAGTAAPAGAGGATQTLDATIEAVVILSLDQGDPRPIANSPVELVATREAGSLVYTLSVTL